MIQIEHKVTKERANVASLTGYSSDWAKVADLPANASAADLPLYGAGTAAAGVIDLALLKAEQIASIKAEAERRRMQFLTPGGAKKTEYADKAAEVRTWHTLGGTLTGVVAVLGIVSGAKMRATFPYAIADAAAFGDTVDKAIERFAAGMSAAASVPSIAAAEAKACADIRKASTALAVRAASTSLGWF